VAVAGLIRGRPGREVVGSTSTRILVTGIPGAVAWAPDGSPFAVLALTVQGGRIVAIDVLADRDRLAQLDLTEVAG
jgi:hypothetical protein